ncbi:O-succinylhomoserine (thiol)-lyase [Micractinium conductrix]|uniref:O-succinylhomoserine (Thiol)-lyase n=1 Tax=Micractinium conductrix TaxID=554055 RepID=A0A2P6VIT1_9CHLO|nr:O-succinylhomoserine (thiol)-lyase [Micractinium conductrix]|eukprot:PSC73994.1 O-succinylhomoserine (thiol)-lyase [Micractinium conductrix]
MASGGDSALKKLTITVGAANGHGVHALLPSEPAVCVVEVPGAQQARGQTKPGRQDKGGTQWGDSLEFEYEGGTPRALHVEVHGQLHGGAVDDLVGAGDVDLHEVLERGTKQVVEVTLTKGGRELGAVELCIQHRAMPDKQLG